MGSSLVKVKGVEEPVVNEDNTPAALPDYKGGGTLLNLIGGVRKPLVPSRSKIGRRYH